MTTNKKDDVGEGKNQGAASSSGPPAHLATILVVDDEQGILDTYTHYLSPGPREGVIKSARRAPTDSQSEVVSGYNLILANTGEKAVDAVRREFEAGRRVQVGFFDMKMPGGIDGLETIRRVREIDPHIYCVIVTAYQDRSLEEIAKVFGLEAFDNWDYLNKPFTANEIIQKARNATVSWTKRRATEARMRAMNETNKALEEAVTKRTEGLAIATQELKEKRAKLEQAIKEITTLNSRRARDTDEE